MPRAKELNTDSTTAKIATRPEVQIEFHTFSGKLTRVQNLMKPSSVNEAGQDSGPLAL